MEFCAVMLNTQRPFFTAICLVPFRDGFVSSMPFNAITQSPVRNFVVGSRVVADIHKSNKKNASFDMPNRSMSPSSNLYYSFDLQWHKSRQRKREIDFKFISKEICIFARQTNTQLLQRSSDYLAQNKFFTNFGHQTTFNALQGSHVKTHTTAVNAPTHYGSIGKSGWQK